MAPLLPPFILFCVFSTYCNCRLTQVYLYGVEWTSSISAKELAAGDTMRVDEIALISNNNAINIAPTITGFEDPSAIVDGDHHTSTYPTEQSFSIKWDFGGQLLPVDYIRFLTNCGDEFPSNFCKDATLIFNNSVGRENKYVRDVNYNIFTIRIVKYDNECDNNTLLLNTAASPQKECNFECEQCLKNIDIDLDTYTMNTLSYLDAANDTECDCPSFKLQLDRNNNLQVWSTEMNDKVALIQRGGNRDFVQLDWNYWMDEQVQCRQMYVPNIEDFMSIPAHSALRIDFFWRHLNGQLFKNNNYTQNQAQIDGFKANFMQNLNGLFSKEWVADVPYFYHIPNGNNSYSMRIISYDQKYSLNAIEFNQIFHHLQNEIHNELRLLLSVHFDTNSSFLTNISSISTFESPHIGFEGLTTCNSYFNYSLRLNPYPPDNDNNASNDETDIVFYLLAVLLPVAILLGCLSIILFLCYKKHLLCFKEKWLVYAPQEGSSVTATGHEQEQEQVEGGAEGMSPKSNLQTPPHHIPMQKSMECDDDLSKAMNRNASVNILVKNVSIIHMHNKHGHVHKLDLNKSQRFTKTDIDKFSDLHYHSSDNDATPKSGPNFNYKGNRASDKLSKNGHFDYSHGNEIKPKHSTYDSTNKLSLPSSPNVRKQNHAFSHNHHHHQHKEHKSVSSKPESQFDSVLTEATRTNKVIEMNFEKDLKLIKCIGEGSFGKVYKANWDAEFVAVKIFTNLANKITTSENMVATTTHGSRGKDHGQSGGGSHYKHGLAVEDVNITSVDDEHYKELYGEIILATSIPPHPNIIRITGYCRNPLCIVMEFMPNGSVQKLVYGLNNNKPIPSVCEKLIILIKACSGLKRLNENKLHHRDVAARNILLGDYEKVIDRDTAVKITDFGMTRKDDDSNEVQKTVNEHGPFKWMAPESIQHGVFDEKTDVYMFGVTMWEIMFGQAPYQHLDDINVAMNVCMKDERPDFLWELPAGLRTLIKECWDKDPKERPTFKVIGNRLERIMTNLEVDIGGVKEMDNEVEQEHDEKELKEQVYAERYIKKTSSIIHMKNAEEHEEFVASVKSADEEQLIEGNEYDDIDEIEENLH